ncbi:hypothetical protein C4Y55_012210 [Klebsiella pneumoniae subsp. pneumoniae]|nr:hypothetical protein CAG40_003165 [Klebsiella pneumoniae]ROG54745.1 hypothetical protein C4Y55_012210 [Klebsiella pneumoniae subsp. pneumoniae]ROG62952.1 hypothetical protein C4Y54_003265 [Klebsiella pneumoniae subsp. pneumoniae]ROG66291.1 hypothetical protein C4Y53_021360 [Klebsiella pneumoniae subsp. pneumoniae]
MLLTLRGMFFSYFSETRELNTVAAKPYLLKYPQKLLCAVGVVPARRQLQSGRISVLALFRRLRACLYEPTAAPPTAMKKNSYNTHH